MSSLIKNSILYFIWFVNGLYASINLLIIFFKVAGCNRTIFVNVEGGFGHTLAAPTCLNALCHDEYYLIFFYTRERHNELTKQIFGDSFIWCKVTIPGLPYFSLSFHKMLGKFFQNTISYFSRASYDLREYFDELTYKPWMIESCYYKEYYSDPYRRTYMMMLSQSIEQLARENKRNFYIKKLDTNPLLDLIDTNRKICAIAHREFPKSNDLSKHSRNSRPLDELEQIISFLTVHANYHVVLCGNVHGNSFEFLKPNPNLTYPALTNFSKNEYDFYAGMGFDIFIGPMSGSLDYARCRQVPTLILDSFPYGWSSPLATIAYRDMKFENIFSLRDFFELAYQNYSIRNSGFVPTNIALNIVSEFVNALDGVTNSIDPKYLGINHGPLIDGNCKVSNAWLNYCLNDFNSKKWFSDAS